MKITWREEAREITSVAQLDGCVADLLGVPTMVFLHAHQGSLAVGVGHATHSVLLYGSTSRDVLLHGVVDPPVPQTIVPPLVFVAAERAVPFFDRIAIPVSVARMVTHSYLITGGQLSQLVDWEPEGSLRLGPVTSV